MIKALQKNGWLRKTILFLGSAIGAYLWVGWLGMALVFLVDMYITWFNNPNHEEEYPNDCLMSILMSSAGILLSILFSLTPLREKVEIIMFVTFWVAVYGVKYTWLSDWLKVKGDT